MSQVCMVSRQVAGGLIHQLPSIIVAVWRACHFCVCMFPPSGMPSLMPPSHDLYGKDHGHRSMADKFCGF
jgi:hypothetical protein